MSANMAKWNLICPLKEPGKGGFNLAFTWIFFSSIALVVRAAFRSPVARTIDLCGWLSSPKWPSVNKLWQIISIQSVTADYCSASQVRSDISELTWSQLYCIVSCRPLQVSNEKSLKVPKWKLDWTGLLLKCFMSDPFRPNGREKTTISAFEGFFKKKLFLCIYSV